MANLPNTLRVFHLDDEAERWGTLPHFLFDRLFDFFHHNSREGDWAYMEPREEDVAKPEGMCFSAINSKTTRAYFSYYFFKDPSALAQMRFSRSDIVISDIFELSEGRDPHRFGRESRAHALAGGVLPENFVYFTAYPGPVIREPSYQVFSKGEARALIDLLWSRLEACVA
jgi:hypothetical protein